LLLAFVVCIVLYTGCRGADLYAAPGNGSGVRAGDERLLVPCAAGSWPCDAACTVPDPAEQNLAATVSRFRIGVLLPPQRFRDGQAVLCSGAGVSKGSEGLWIRTATNSRVYDQGRR
jgi:hypothetical protein